MKKKILITIICVIFIAMTSFILYLKLSHKGDISNVNIIANSSQIYSKKEIDDAINVILHFFRQNFNGCILEQITYIGDDYNKDYQDWAERNNKEEVIVLVSNFKTNSYCSETLNHNSEYKNWNWILVKNKDENWEHVDHGY